MKTKYIILLSILPTIIILDQWTKFLAVKHLTYGLEDAYREEQKVLQKDMHDDRPAIFIDDLPFSTQIHYFYTSVVNPRSKIYKEIIPSFWNHIYVENKGAAWGILSQTDDSFRIPFFTTVSIIAIIFIFLFFRKLTNEQVLLQFALAMVLGGALGNFTDRVHLQYVIDFIDWYIQDHHWPTFNVADSSISVGFALLILDMLLNKKVEPVPNNLPHTSKSSDKINGQ